MSVQAIRQSIKDRIAIPNNYTEAKHTLDLSKNSNLGQENRYALAIGSQSEVDGVTRFSTMDQTFNLTIMKEFKASKDDFAILSKIEEMHLDLDVFYADFVNSRLANSDVMNVSSRNISEPEVNYEDKTIYLTMDFVVKYRFVT